MKTRGLQLKTSRPKLPEHKDFVAEPLHYYPRIDRSINLLLVGALLLFLGVYLISNDLPVTSSYLTQLIIQVLPTTLGAVFVVFSAVGLATALKGAARKGKESIDLALKPSGITVRGGSKISWESIAAVIDVQQVNDAKAQILWDRGDLNRVIDIQLTDASQIPGSKIRHGQPTLRVSLRHYPALEYRPLYEATLDQFERRGIPVESVRKQVQF